MKTLYLQSIHEHINDKNNIIYLEKENNHNFPVRNGYL